MLRRLLVLTTVIAAVGATAPVASAEADGKPHKNSYGATELTVDPDTLAALGTLGVAPGFVPRQPGPAPPMFPITNRIRSALRAGKIRHAGGITL